MASSSSQESFVTAREDLSHNDSSTTCTLTAIYSTGQSTLMEVGLDCSLEVGCSSVGSTIRQDSGIPAAPVTKFNSVGAQKKYLPRLMQFVSDMDGKDFSTETSDGHKITYDTFFDVKKLTSEVVQRIVVMLLVKFGFMRKEETVRGLPVENWKPLEAFYFNKCGVNPPRTNFTVDDLHAKILCTFFRNSDPVGNYYDSGVLFCPELNPKKTRTALSYFTHFCIVFTEWAQKQAGSAAPQIPKRPNQNQDFRGIELRKKDETLRAKIQEEELIAVQLDAELEEEQMRQNQAETEAARVESNEELDPVIQRAQELMQLEDSHKQASPVASSSKSSVRMNPEASSADTETSKGAWKPSCTNHGCEERHRRHKEMAEKIALVQRRNSEAEEVVGRCERLISGLQTAKVNLEKAKARRRREEINEEDVKAMIVKVKQLEQEIRTNRKRHQRNVEGMRSRLAVKQRILETVKEKGQELDKKLEDLMCGMSLEDNDVSVYTFMDYRDPSNESQDLDESHNN